MDKNGYFEELQRLMQEIEKITGSEERERLAQQLINKYNDIINNMVKENWQNYHREHDGRNFLSEIDISNYVKEKKLFQSAFMEEDENQSTLDKIEKQQELMKILKGEEERLQTTMEQFQKTILDSTEELFGAHECPVEQMVRSCLRRTDFDKDDVVAEIMSGIRKKVDIFNQQTIFDYQVSLTPLQHQIDDLIDNGKRILAMDQATTVVIPEENKKDSLSFDIGTLFTYEATKPNDTPTSNLSELFDEPPKDDILQSNVNMEEPSIWDRMLAYEEGQGHIKEDIDNFLLVAGTDLNGIIQNIQSKNTSLRTYLQPECGVIVRQVDYPDDLEGNHKKVMISEKFFDALTQTEKMLPDIRLYRYHDEQDDKDAFVILTEEEGKRLEMRNPSMENHRIPTQSNTIESPKENNPQKNAQEYDGLLW